MQNQIIAVTIFLLSGSLSSTYFQPYITIFELILFVFILTLMALNLSEKKQKKDTNLFRIVLILSLVILISMINSLFLQSQSLFTALNNHFKSILAILILSNMSSLKNRYSYKLILRYLEILTFVTLFSFTLTQTIIENQIIIVKGALSGKSHVYEIRNIGSIFFVFFGIFRVNHFVRNFDFKSFFLATAFLSYPMVYQNSRILIIALAIVACFGLFSSSRKFRQKALFIGSMMAAVFLCSYLIGGSDSFIQSKIKSINSAATLVLTGNSEGSNIGTSIRALEFQRAFNVFKSNYLLGTGSIGSSWGTSGDTYFYSSDIGILGIILEVGVLGFLLLVYVLRRVYIIFNKTSYELRLFFICLLIINITTGFLYFELLPTVMILVLALIKIAENDSMDSCILL